MTKVDLESLGRQFGIELDRRLTKDKLIKQVKKDQKDVENQIEVVEEVMLHFNKSIEWKEILDVQEDTSGRWTVRKKKNRNWFLKSC